uniref:Ovule protein n=1 Tax=Mesocestoides corti TaxID=53468 RepID=A0A5K3FZY9_MESCO
MQRNGDAFRGHKVDNDGSRISFTEGFVCVLPSSKFPLLLHFKQFLQGPPRCQSLNKAVMECRLQTCNTSLHFRGILDFIKKLKKDSTKEKN